MSKKPDFDRRRFVGVAVATVAAGPLGVFDLSRRVNAATKWAEREWVPNATQGVQLSTAPHEFQVAS